MALTRFYLHPVRKGSSPATEGYATAQDAATAAQDFLLNGNSEPGMKVGIVKLMAVVEVDNPVTKSTDASLL